MLTSLKCIESFCAKFILQRSSHYPSRVVLLFASVLNVKYYCVIVRCYVLSLTY